MLLPSISILIPTLNAGCVLEDCLKSISDQVYPKELLEIVIADGGSTDNTIEIGKRYGAKIFENKLRTGESGKAVALRNSLHEVVAFIDSDNILPERDWLFRMVRPLLDDPTISVSEPIEFTRRVSDGFITRYCALVGANDPLVLFLGNYDRLNVLTGKWTGVNVGEQKDMGSYVVINLTNLVLPTIGANGTLMRKQFVGNVAPGTYLFDIDLISKAIQNGQSVKVAKVKVGIIHLYCGSSIRMFIKKQSRRILDFNHHQKRGTRVYSWHKQNRFGLVRFGLYSLFILPTVWQSLTGYLKKKDSAWFFHPLACWLTLIVYFLGVIRSFFSAKEASRDNWSQGRIQ